MNRVYFSAYQRGLGDASLSASQGGTEGSQAVFVREHRLYQVDFLMRKYGFCDADVPFDADGNLSLDTDPKEAWALRHPEYFPLDVNRASRLELLRVPGLGPLTVSRIVTLRQTQRIGSLEAIGRVGARLSKAGKYLVF
jgi:predicted DNA-binding helix-hairpin-helix protein